MKKARLNLFDEIDTSRPIPLSGNLHPIGSLLTETRISREEQLLGKVSFDIYLPEFEEEGCILDIFVLPVATIDLQEVKSKMETPCTRALILRRKNAEGYERVGLFELGLIKNWKTQIDDVRLQHDWLIGGELQKVTIL